MKQFLRRATEGMNAKFSTNFSTPFLEVLVLLVLVFVLGTAFGIGLCFVFNDVNWQYFAVSYGVVATIIVKVLWL